MLDNRFFLSLLSNQKQNIMKYSKKELEVINELEKLVNNRFNEKTLNEKLSKVFEENIKVNDVTNEKDDCDTSDWNFIFSSNKKETYGYFDIFYLKMRKPSISNDTIYITEVSYEFGS